jgi:hypothetical protein
MISALLSRLAGFIGLPTLVVSVALLCFTAGLIGGGALVTARKDAGIARLERDHALAQASASKALAAALENVRAVEAKGDTLAREQLALEARARQLNEEKEDAIRKLTTGRVCLDAAVVGLLNQRRAVATSPGLRPPASGAAGSIAAVATDTDVALWAANARDQYDLCRGRIDALRQFFQQEE